MDRPEIASEVAAARRAFGTRVSVDWMEWGQALMPRFQEYMEVVAANLTAGAIDGEEGQVRTRVRIRGWY